MFVQVRRVWGVCVAALVIAALLGVAVPGAVAAPAGSGQWSWASRTNLWDRNGEPITPELYADPLGKRQGQAIKVDFEPWGWSFTCDNAGEPFYFVKGRDYTVLITAYCGCGHHSGTDLRVTAGHDVWAPRVASANAWVDIPSGEWCTKVFYLEDFPAATGGYFLDFHDQWGEGCWLLGDIKVTGGLGH